GPTGETPLLDHDEQAAVIEACARVCRERDVPMIVGAGTNDTRSTIAATNAPASGPAATPGVCVRPYYLRPGQDGIVAHFEAVAAASPVPLVLYNIPGRTG